MTPASAGEKRLARLQEHVSIALQEWDATNLAACDSASDALQRALGELESIRSAWQGGAPSTRTAMVHMLEDVRRDAGRLARLIDASQAYCRGLTLRSGGDAVLDHDGAGRSEGLGQA